MNKKYPRRRVVEWKPYGLRGWFTYTLSCGHIAEREGDTRIYAIGKPAGSCVCYKCPAKEQKT